MNTTTEINAMTAQELTKIILNQERLFIVDVRNESDFNNWKVEGEQIEIINLPYFDLLDGVDHVLEQIPENEPVLVICSKEGSSIFVAEQLVEAGRSQLFYLQGGMKSWSEYLEPIKVAELQNGGELYQFVRIGKGCLSYMIISEGEAAVVDTLRMTDIYEQFALEKRARITHTIDTHLHADHISGGKKLAESIGATYWLPSKDAEELTFDYAKLEDGHGIGLVTCTLHYIPVTRICLMI